MPDVEKVISDLEEQIAWIRDNDFHKFPGWGHAVIAMKDALALLKAQEPMVMTLEEVEKTYSKRPIWFDEVRLQTVYPAIYHKTGGPEGCKFAVITDFYYGKQNWAYGTYGKDWRCWDKEPTKEQREATPWNAQN